MPVESLTQNRLLTDLQTQADPAHTALLIIDMQNDFCADGGFIDRVLGKDVSACQAVAEPIEQLLAAARKASVHIVWVRAHYDRDTQAEPVLAKQAQNGIDDVCCAAGSWGAGFFGPEPAAGEPVITKHRYSAFFGTGLHEHLGQRGIRTLVPAGVQTNVCIESSLRDGFMLGYYIVLAKDAVASHTPSLHDATLQNVAMLFGTVTDSAALTELWS